MRKEWPIRLFERGGVREYLSRSRPRLNFLRGVHAASDQSQSGERAQGREARADVRDESKARDERFADGALDRGPRLAAQSVRHPHARETAALTF